MLSSWEMGACLFSKYFKDKCLLHQTQNRGSLKYPSTMDMKYQLWEECQVWLACYILHYSLFLRGHTWGRKSVFYLHLDNHRTCMNRLYTSRIFPILRKNKKNKKLSEHTTQTTSFHKNNQFIQPFMADTCFRHTPKLWASSCFQPTVCFLSTAYCISSNTLVWIETCFHPST